MHRLPTLCNAGISPLSLLVALSGGSGQFIFILVDHKQPSSLSDFTREQLGGKMN